MTCLFCTIFPIFFFFPSQNVLYCCAGPVDDEFGEKTVSVLLDGEESEIVFIDHPSSEMSVSFSIASSPIFFSFVWFPNYWSRIGNNEQNVYKCIRLWMVGLFIRKIIFKSLASHCIQKHTVYTFFLFIFFFVWIVGGRLFPFFCVVVIRAAANFRCYAVDLWM